MQSFEYQQFWDAMMLMWHHFYEMIAVSNTADDEK